MLEPEPSVRDQLRCHPLPKSATAALCPTQLLLPVLPETAASVSPTPLLTPAKIRRHAIPKSTTDPCPILPPPHPRLRCHLTYHHPPLPPPSCPTTSVPQRQHGQRSNQYPCLLLHAQILHATEPISEGWKEKKLGILCLVLCATLTMKQKVIVSPATSLNP